MQDTRSYAMPSQVFPQKYAKLLYAEFYRLALTYIQM